VHSLQINTLWSGSYINRSIFETDSGSKRGMQDLRTRCAFPELVKLVRRMKTASGAPMFTYPPSPHFS
jgi:hypothetical protein